MNRREWHWVALVALALVVASSLPYLIAWAVRPEGAHFTGLLVNPLDGHSYIAKMRQGLDGSWRFRLASTPEPQEGAYLYLLHIALGHVARWAGLPLIAVYHGARVLAGVFLVLVAHRFAGLLGRERGQRRLALLLVCISSGLGWLVAPGGTVTADLWVPEAFVFYSMLDTLHFPLAIGLTLMILIELAWPGREPGWRQALAAAVGSIGLGVVQPFGVIPVYATLAVWLGLRWLRDRRVAWRTAGWTAVAGLVAVAYPLYGVLAIGADPVLAGWSAQNQTPSPPVWDWLLSFGLLTALAVPGVVTAVRRRSDGGLLLVAWVIAAGVGMYAPLALQRRLALGLQVPLALLAAAGWWQVIRPRLRVRLQGPVTVAMVALSSLTNLFLVVMLVLAALGGEPRFYLSDGEWRALAWLREEVDHDQVVLCAPQTGMFVPAWAGQRVVYGHPFETVDAERREAQVKAYWAGEMSRADREAFLRANRVGYVLAGPRELEIGDWRLEVGELEGEMVFEAGDVRVWEVGGREGAGRQGDRGTGRQGDRETGGQGDGGTGDRGAGDTGTGQETEGRRGGARGKRYGAGGRE